MADPDLDTEVPDSTDDTSADSAKRSLRDRAQALWVRAKEEKLKASLGFVAFLGVAYAAIWFGTRGDSVPPAVRQEQAFALLDGRGSIKSRQQARKIAQALDEENYRDVKFQGAIEFIGGITAFRDAQDAGQNGSAQDYIAPERLLLEAQSRGVIVERQPEWAYALAVSVYRLGKASEARPLLEKAVATYKPKRTELSLLLTEVYLDLKTPEALEKALVINRGLMETDGLPQTTLDRVYLQRAQTLLALNRSAEAEEALSKVSQATSKNRGTIVFRAQTLIAEEKYAAAMKILEPIVNDIGLEQTYPRQASFLMGVASEKLGDADAAINYYERTAQKYENTPESLAANLRAADLLRQAEPVARNEEALEAYRRALRTVKDPQDFRNRWLSLKEFRRLILDAWNQWRIHGAYAEAIALSELMTPLLPTVQADELKARANQYWAEELEQQLRDAPFSEWKSRTAELYKRWRLSGEAYDTLATSLKSSSKFPDALWISARQFRRGHDFDRALTQLTRFINTRPKELLPDALVSLGEVFMDLDRLDEALDLFQRVVENYPTSNAAYDARYLVGKVQLEQNELDAAEATWREVIAFERLDPSAPLWKLSLFSLGRLQYHRASLLLSKSLGIQSANSKATQEQLLSEAFSRWDEAVRRLEEFLKRYPKDPGTADDEYLRYKAEARYLLAKSLQHRADGPRRRLKKSETENARLELRRVMNVLLRQAIQEFRTLQSNLLEIGENDRLGELGQQLLLDCYFEIAHTYFALEQYEEAIVSYSSAANRYPKNAQVLVAYVQMTNCYDKLGKPAEARSMLEQAKVILKQMPDEVFDPKATNMTREQWGKWLDWARRLHKTANAGVVTGS